jgi:hypothetical protein
MRYACPARRRDSVKPNWCLPTGALPSRSPQPARRASPYRTAKHRHLTHSEVSSIRVMVTDCTAGRSPTR